MNRNREMCNSKEKEQERIYIYTYIYLFIHIHTVVFCDVKLSRRVCLFSDAYDADRISLKQR
jgi:hypothetical protein